MQVDATRVITARRTARLAARWSREHRDPEARRFEAGRAAGIDEVLRLLGLRGVRLDDGKRQGRGV